MRDDIARYEANNILIFGVNGGNARSHRNFAHRLQLPVPLLVDRRLKVAQRYGAVLNLGFLKLIKRTVVGIDANGVIVFYKRGMPATDEIVGAFEERVTK